MATFKFYSANVVQVYNNCLYPNKIDTDDIEILKKALSHDCVAAKYTNNYRDSSNFEEAYLLMKDCDNDFSDNPEDFIDFSILEKLFSDCTFFYSPSKSNMKEKKGKGGKTFSARPRGHVGFVINKITSPEEYKRLHERAQELFGFFDEKAKDIAHFMAGNPNAEVFIHKGNMMFDDFINTIYEEKSFEKYDEKSNEIPAGSRNDTMHKIACNLIVRYGISEEAKEKYREASTRCNPSLDKDELNTIWKSATKFYKKDVVTNPSYKAPKEYNNSTEIKWDDPIPFKKINLPAFPVDALPKIIADYVKAVSETTQTPVDMAATSSLAIMSLCMQGRYSVQAKLDWKEPLNLYTLIIAEPSERKSAIISLMTKVLIEYEVDYNKTHAATFEFSKMAKQALESKKKSFESLYVKGKKTKEEMKELALEIADFKENIPKKLYVDDITTEKLTSVISDNGGKTAVISSEGGIFDVLAGMYNKNVNIDVLLKAYSGDSIRVDRIGRPGELISNPTLTILLSVQPSVLTNVMQNCTFEGKGLTSRFLYTIPTSMIGYRRYKTSAIPTEITAAYCEKIKELLAEEDDLSFQPTTIYLMQDASDLLEEYFDENEKAMISENQEIKSWCGKIVGNVLRISGILARMDQKSPNYFLNSNTMMTVSKTHVERAIKIGKYFTEHAKAAHSLMGIDPINKQCEYVISNIKKNNLHEFNKRDLMRTCRSFKKVDELVPVITRLSDYGYIQQKQESNKQSQIYLVNPAVFTSSLNQTANQ